MAKASLVLPDGTKVTVDGSPEEIQLILSIHSRAGSSVPRPSGQSVSRRQTRSKARPAKTKGTAETKSAPNISAIVNAVKNCKEAEAIEKMILEARSTLNRTLLPLFVVQRELKGDDGLTSGDISKVLRELRAPVAQPAVSRCLSGEASKYVMGDKVRRKGQAVHYRLNLRGEKYLASVLEPKPAAKKH